MQFAFMSPCVSPTVIGIGPWKMGMLAACLLLWDVMWGSITPSFKEDWKIQVIRTSQSVCIPHELHM